MSTFDPDNPHHRAIYPDQPDVGWYDSTPGYAPSYRGISIQIGTVVSVRDQGLLRDGWVGRIVEHMLDGAGGYYGLSIAECLDTGGILNKVVGRADQVEITNCTVIDEQL
ncbi:hypothetical protein AB0J43_02560 [Nonomuraea fuscirosea]